jgi:hypothetical protein
VGDGGGVELGGVNGDSNRGLDSRAESLGVAEADESDRVNLGLDEGSVVKVSLGSNLEADVGGRGCIDRTVNKNQFDCSSAL